MRVSSRMEGLGLSPIRAMQAGAPPGSVSLCLGEPGWELPEPGRKALAAIEDRALGERTCSYGPNSGLPELAGALSAFYGRSPEEIMVASGSEGALYSIFQAWLDPGEEVLVPDPGFLAYPALARLAGAVPRPYGLGPCNSLDPGAFAAALSSSPRAKIAVVNHPANPTGGGASAEALAAVAELCRERCVILLSDEVYRELYLDSRPPSLGEVSDYGVVLSSASKAWGGPGLRVGWALGDPEILAPARLVHNYAVTAASRPAQEAAAALIKASDSVLPAAREELAKRWEVLERVLSSGLGLEAGKPSGGFYCWLPIPEGYANSYEFCLAARDRAKVILSPGSAFGAQGEGFVRLSFAARPADLALGLERLGLVWRKA